MGYIINKTHDALGLLQEDIRKELLARLTPYQLLYLETQTARHFSNNCNCDLTDGGRRLCTVGSWLESCITTDDLVEHLRDIITN